MLIPDLLNMLFDQADYNGLVILKSLGKNRTKYANKYSVLGHYDLKSVKLYDICKNGLIKNIVHLALRGGIVNGGVIDCALRWSAEYGHLETVKYLTSIGVNIDADDALRWTACGGRISVVKYLISIGANIHVRDDIALRGSAQKGHLEVVKYLVGIGANIHAGNIHTGSKCALRHSAERGHLEIIEYLINNGADVHVDNNILFKLDIIKNNFSHLL